MNREKLKACIFEAERFLKRAKALPKPQPYEHSGYIFPGDSFPKEQASIRRASMDLTRALAELRKQS